MPASRIAEAAQLTRTGVRMELHRHPDGFERALVDDLAVVAQRLFDLGLGELQGLCGLLDENLPRVSHRGFFYARRGFFSAEPSNRFKRTMHRVNRVSDFRLWDLGFPDQRFEQRVDLGLPSPELVSAPTCESDQGVEHEQAWHLQGVLIDRAGERLYRFVGVDEPEVHADLRGDSGGEGVEGGDRRPLRASLLGGLPVEFPSRLVASFHIQNILTMSREFPGSTPLRWLWSRGLRRTASSRHR